MVGQPDLRQRSGIGLPGDEARRDRHGRGDDRELGTARRLDELDRDLGEGRRCNATNLCRGWPYAINHPKRVPARAQLR